MDVVSPPEDLARIRRWAWVSAVANAGLIITGGLVRLTKSGLGCPTWPKCRESYLPDDALGIHGLIEFGNRALTFVLVALAIVTFVVALRSRGPVRRPAIGLSLGIGLGIIGQALVGGLTVLSKVNPWVVSLHLVLSLVLVALCLKLVDVATRRPALGVGRWARRVVLAVVVAAYVVMALGTVVTGAGPNSGDDAARRSGLDLYTTARIHAFAVWALVALSVVALALLWRTAARGPALNVVGIELFQGAIGYWQYFAGLSWGLVAFHMVGVAAFALAVPRLWFAVRSLHADKTNQPDPQPSAVAA